MKLKLPRPLVLLAIALASFAGIELSAQTTAFTYQGRLNDGGNPANGSYDLTFTLFDASNGVNQVGSVLTNTATTLNNGLFTVTLDFGNQFPGTDRWLEIGVRTNGGASFSALSPRQRLTAMPYTVRALNAGTADSAASVAAANIAGVLSPAQLPPNVLTNNQSTAVTLTGTFSGNGSGLTNLNATNLFGAIADQRLSSNVALLNGANVFSGTNRFSNVLIATNLNNQFLGVFAGNGNALTNLAATNLSGAVSLAQLPSGVVTNGAAGLSLSGSFTGNGGALTNIDIGQGSGGSIQTLSFTLASQLAAGDVSQTLIAVDVNNDGKPDLIDARFNTPAAFVVFTNNGSGGFVASSTNLLSPATQPRRVVAADFNGDNRMDLIFVTQNSTAIVFTNDGSGGFASSQNFSTISSTPYVTVADVNNDNKPDVIIAEFSSSTVQVYTNNGSGQLVSMTTFNGFGPSDVAAADVNGDGKVDIITANQGSGVFVFTNNGTGFGFSTNIAGFSANKIISVDVNNDGKPDLVTTVSLATNRLTIYTNNGSGGFAIASSAFSAGFANGVFAADMDGDGRPDLLVPNNGTNSVSILINNGGGNFSLKTSLPTGTSPQAAAAADFNADGKTDFAAAGSGSGFNSVYVYLNAGVTFNGTFVGSGSSLSNLTASQLTSGTITDARLSTNVALLNAANVFTASNRFSNVVIATNANNTLSGLLSGTFSGNGAALTSLNAGNISSGTLLDARLSPNVALLSSNQTFSGAVQFSGTLSSGALSGSGSGITNLDIEQNSGGAIQMLSFTLSSQPNVGDSTPCVTTGDVNNDGKPDIIAAGLFNNTIIVMTNNGSGGFVSATNVPAGLAGPQTVIARDINNDTRIDLIVADAAQSIRAFTNNGSGGFGLSSTVTLPSSGADSVIAADLNNDGKPDLIAADNNAGTLQTYTNNGSGVFGFFANVSAPGAEAVAVADVNGDGRVDLISVSLSPSLGVLVFTNNGTGGYGLFATLTGIIANKIIAVDVNGDGRLDFVTGYFVTNRLAVYTNSGNGLVLASQPVSGGLVQSIAAADFNGDGRPDLVVANGNGTDSILVNLGGGNFALRETLTEASGPQTVATADFNGDGKQDLVTGGSGFANTVYVHMNNGVVFQGAFLGNGASLTNLSANSLTGTISDQRLSSNVALLNTNQSFTASNRFAGVVVATNVNNQFTGAFTGNGSGLTNLYPMNLVSALAINTTVKFAGDRTNGIANSVVFLQNTNTSAAAAPALRVQNDGGNTPFGALSVSANVAATAPNSILAQFGNSSSFVVVITNDGTIYSKGVALTSDRNAKESFRTVDGKLILEKVASLPMNEWDYKDTPGIRHLGPMAQDFHAAFGLNGNDEHHISVVDEGGVALAAIQGLNEKLEARGQRSDVQIQRLETENAELKARLEMLEKLLSEKPNQTTK